MSATSAIRPVLGLGIVAMGVFGLMLGRGQGPPGDDYPEGHEEDRWAAARRRMVQTQIEARGVRDARVLEALRTVPRHLFVPRRLWSRAHDDRALPLDEGQTISQPYIVALMTELAAPKPGDVALDVGTGSGYQAAVLSSLVKRVASIEIVPALASEAKSRLERLGYDNVEVRCGDGSAGWPDVETFDVIIAAAAPAEVPDALLRQLAPGGRLVMPVGEEGHQRLIRIQRLADGGLERTEVIPVAFVPMTGSASAG
jgi:protein-L-isoaspartate(D-aspartate) O-methyltransferase